MSYERARSLSLEQQMSECIDLLQHPELIVAEVQEAFRIVESQFISGALSPEFLSAERKRREAERSEHAWFYMGRDLSVLGDSCSFTCLSSYVDPLAGPPEASESPKPPKESRVEGFDFVGLTCDSKPAPVIGAVQSEVDTTAYPLLMRLLAGLAEMAPVVQIARLNAQAFQGALSGIPRFDLNIVTWETSEDEERTPISQFTRDLAELVKLNIMEQGAFPGVLRDIVCLRMNPLRFDGRMRFDWRV